MTTHTLKVTIAHIRPAIWRRLSAPSDITLDVLHDALQLAFGWQGSHLHEFRAGDARFGVPDPDDEALLDEAEVTLAEALPRKASRLDYIYDLGDYWTHTISVEHIEEAAPSSYSRSLRPRHRAGVITCLDGECAPPPEDCGGPAGYADLLDALADPKNPRHAAMVEWVGGDFDPEPSRSPT